jgi:hypothetical protein
MYPDRDQAMQIENTDAGDTVFFAYDPSIDSILQTETQPYNVQGVFKSEADVGRFLNWYTKQYGLSDASRFEVYAAELEYLGQGHDFVPEVEEEDRIYVEEVTQQVEFEDCGGESQ